MIFRLNALKLRPNLCKFHSNLFQRKSNYFLKVSHNFNEMFNCYTNSNNNNNKDNNWSDIDFFDANKRFKTSKDKNHLLLKEIYKLKDSADESALKLMSSAVGQMQTQSESLVNFNDNESNSGANSDWFDILSKAEQVVKYPTSFLSLRFLLKDEISYLAIHLKRLIDTKHPLLQTAKTILSTNQQIRGLVVLLLSKAYSYPKHILDNFDTTSETNRLAVITKCQRKLAEITDMIHVSQVLHRGVIDIPVLSTHDNDINSKVNEDLQLGNTISVLIGDFLLAQSSRGLALIRNPTITGLMAKAIGNYSEGEFLRSQLLKQLNSAEALDKYCYLSGGSLLGHSCKSAILLAQYSLQIQTEAFDIGKHIGIAFQLSDLLYRLLSADNKTIEFEEELQSIDRNLIKVLLKSNVNKAIALINNLDKSEAREALTDIVFNIENVKKINDFH